jgi:Ca-activated chloride channel family protein
MNTLNTWTLGIVGWMWVGSAAAAPIICKVSPERDALLAGKAESLTVKVSLEGVRPERASERPAVNLALVIDRSGSMGGDKIERAKAAAIEAVGRLEARDIVSVTLFNSEASLLVPAQPATDKQAIIERIRSVTASGGTAIFGGVSLAQAEMHKWLDTRRVNRLVLLSDGQANVGPSSPEELGRLGFMLVKQGISASTIGLGLDYNEDLMTSLSAKSDGNSYFARSADDLPRIFSAELNDVLTVVGKSVRLRVRFTNGALATELVGRDGRIEDNTVTVDFNQIYGGQAKYAMIRATLPQGAARESRVFAEAEVTFFDPAADRTVTARAEGRIAYVADPAAAERSVNKVVTSEKLLIENSLAVEQAIRLSDEGRNAEAAAILERNAAVMEEKAKKLDLRPLREAASVQRSRAAAAAAAPIGGALRKEMKADNHQLQNQQSIPN